MSFPQSCVVLGTDTHCGKTHLSQHLLRMARQTGTAIGMKPVATGWDTSTPPETQEDVAALRALSFPIPDIRDQCPYLFPNPISPHLAARYAGAIIDPAIIQQAFKRLHALADCIIVESAGGILSPLNDTLDMVDLPALLHLPALLVVELKLGCINQGKLAAEALSSRNIPMLGWLSNQRPETFMDHEYKQDIIDTLKQAIPFAYIDLGETL